MSPAVAAVLLSCSLWTAAPPEAPRLPDDEAGQVAALGGIEVPAPIKPQPIPAGYWQQYSTLEVTRAGSSWWETRYILGISCYQGARFLGVIYRHGHSEIYLQYQPANRPRF